VSWVSKIASADMLVRAIEDGGLNPRDADDIALTFARVMAREVKRLNDGQLALWERMGAANKAPGREHEALVALVHAAERVLKYLPNVNGTAGEAIADLRAAVGAGRDVDNVQAALETLAGKERQLDEALERAADAEQHLAWISQELGLGWAIPSGQSDPHLSEKGLAEERAKAVRGIADAVIREVRSLRELRARIAGMVAEPEPSDPGGGQ